MVLRHMHRSFVPSALLNGAADTMAPIRWPGRQAQTVKEGNKLPILVSFSDSSIHGLGSAHVIDILKQFGYLTLALVDV